jgi:glycosyltransferase involved in cell wall biosynthesis
VYRIDSGLGIADVPDGDNSRREVSVFSALHSESSLREQFAAILDSYDVCLVHVHHLLGWPQGVWAELQQRQIPFFYTTHDFYCVCPNYTLFDFSSGQECRCDLNSPNTAACLHSFARISNTHFQANLNRNGVRAHRIAFQKFFEHAAGLIFPSTFARDVVASYFDLPPGRAYVIPHGLPRPFSMEGMLDGALRYSNTLRVGIVGYVYGAEKGYDNYVELIRLTRQEPIDWHIFGNVPASYQREMKGARNRAYFAGPYSPDVLGWLLFQYGIDVVVMMPRAAETFSYALSEVLAAGIPVLGPTRGAIAQRLRDLGLGDCIASDINEFSRRLIHLSDRPEEIAALKSRVARIKLPDLNGMTSELLQLYRTHADVRWESAVG